jgi:hypothetical protein
MIKDIIQNYKSSIETPMEMVSVLTQYRNNLMKEYSTNNDWTNENALPCIDMILRLDETIRRYNFLIQLNQEKEESRQRLKNQPTK